MIKQFSAGDIVTRPFKTFKNWKVQSVLPNEVDQFGESTYLVNIGEVNKGKNISGSFYQSGSSKYNPATEPITPNGKYERIIYNTTDAMFYRGNPNPLELFGVENLSRTSLSGNSEVRKIHDKIVTLRLAKNFWGEKIVPNSVKITDNSSIHKTSEIYDDGMTNLYITGSNFSEEANISAIRPVPTEPVWSTGSVNYYTIISGVTQSLSFAQAKSYMDMGMNVWFEELGNGWSDASLSSASYFVPENERFGQSVSTWYNYIAVGSPQDNYSLSKNKTGYSAIYRYDDSTNQHRLIKKFLSPKTAGGITQEFGGENNSLFLAEKDYLLQAEASGNLMDEFGYSVSVNNNFLAIGAPSGGICLSTGSGGGAVYVYDRYKGGDENWGIINVLQSGTNGDRFGNAVSISDDILAVGAPGYSGSIGAVYIFRLKRYMDKTNPCRSIQTASFWYQTTACGTPERDVTGSIIYTSTNTPSFASGNFSWEYEATLTSSIGSSNDNFGWVLQADNDKVIIGNRKTNGDGYATLYTCGYISASLGGCPTASWSETKIYYANNDFGNLDTNNTEYATQTTLNYNGFGWSVAIQGDSMAIGSYYDKGFLPYSSAPVSELKIFGSVYFYKKYYDDCGEFGYHFLNKTFGNVDYSDYLQFGRAISIDGENAAISSEPQKTFYSVSYSGSYTLESSSYSSSSPTDALLGKIDMYKIGGDDIWRYSGEIRRNKEENVPFYNFGKAVAMSSNFLVVGSPIYNYATGSNSGSVIDRNEQISSSFSEKYSGSIFVYDMENYEIDPLIGNVFYKNGYFVITSTGSNYENILTKTGSFGFVLTYKGTHTIYENEYFVSIRPGEFNYSTNPTALISNPLLFDVNQDGAFDFSDVDLIMRYLNKKRFYEDFVFDDNGIILEQDNRIRSWWNNDILMTEAGDVLLKEDDIVNYLNGIDQSLFTKKVFDYIEKNLIQTGILDIDGNGIIDGKDSAILLAYFTNKLTPQSLDQWTDENSTRKYVGEVEEYIGRYSGQKTFNVNPEFFGYQSSSSYDPTGSYLAPYITTIGLYSNGELVAVSKLGKPIKNLIDWPINFIVRFDT